MLSLATLRPKKPSVQPPDPNIRSGFRETAGKAASPNCSNNQTLRGTTRGVLLEILGDVPAMSPIGRVSRVSPVHTAMCNCTRDGGGPFEVGNQVLISNHCKLLSSNAMVVSVAANVGSNPSG